MNIVCNRINDNFQICLESSDSNYYLNRRSLTSFLKILDKIEKDDGKIIVEAVNKRIFCAGFDPSYFHFDTKTNAEIIEGLNLGQSLVRKILALKDRVVFNISGLCEGAAFEFALAGKIVVQGKAFFRFPEYKTNYKIIPGYGGAYLLSKTIGEAPAIEHILNPNYIEFGGRKRILPNKEVDVGLMNDLKKIIGSKNIEEAQLNTSDIFLKIIDRNRKNDNV